MGALSSLKKAKPLVSKFDEALANLTRPKGTGTEFLTEVMKQPGVKKAEIEDRKLKQAFEKAGKITKEQAQELAQKHASPKIEEKILKDQGEKFEELEKIAESEYGEAFEDLHPSIQDQIERDFDAVAAKYGEYRLPGGSNYREMLLKLPSMPDAEKERLMQLEAKHRRLSEPAQWVFEESPEGQEMKALKDKAQQSAYYSSHWGKDEPNVLAHMRVQDRIQPTYTTEQAKEIGQRIADALGVADQKNLGNGSIAPAIKNGWVTPKEAAQYADYRGFQGVDTTGAKEKILHVEEIQSDWHQAGRKHGYKGQHTGEMAEYQKLLKEFESGANWDDAQYEKFYELQDKLGGGMGAESQSKIPDAPFKKNWHELAMKRLINHAAENGYDKIAITPGAEQASRYDLSKQVDQLLYQKNPDGTYRLTAKVKGDNQLIGNALDESQLEQHVGKDVAEKIISGSGKEIKNTHYSTGSELPSDYVLSGLDLQVGGEGMKGFYDKMLPDYLNTLGKKHGIKVGEIDIETHPAKVTPQVAAPGIGHFPEPIVEPAQTKKVHSFDITPELREEVTTKGLPLYQQIGLPLGTGAGSYEFNAPEPEYAAGGAVNYNTDPDMNDGGAIIQGAPYKKGGKVRITDNLDEMFMHVNNKKFQRK